jgi:hypothetical protein
MAATDTIFDSLLNKTAQVVKRVGGSTDTLGIADPTFTNVGSPVPVMVSSSGGGREKRAGAKFGVNQRRVFMRPFTTPEMLTHEHWLVIDGEYYDIQAVNNPAGLDHHFECECQLVKV